MKDYIHYDLHQITYLDSIAGELSALLEFKVLEEVSKFIAK
jgi:hypothetical protein